MKGVVTVEMVRFTQGPRAKVAHPRALKNKVARQFFLAVLQQCLLEPHHITLLEQACFALQRAEEARILVDKDGMVLVGETGKLYGHPAVLIERDNRTVFTRIVRELGLDLVQDEPARPPVRSGRATQ